MCGKSVGLHRICGRTTQDLKYAEICKILCDSSDPAARYMVELNVEHLEPQNFSFYPRAEVQGDQLIHSRVLSVQRNRESYWVIADIPVSSRPNARDAGLQKDTVVCAVQYFFCIQV